LSRFKRPVPAFGPGRAFFWREPFGPLRVLVGTRTGGFHVQAFLNV
jgi:hypothetical protein